MARNSFLKLLKILCLGSSLGAGSPRDEPTQKPRTKLGHGARRQDPAVLWLRLERLLDPCWNSRGQISQDDADEQTEQGVQDIVESVEVLALEHAKSEGEEDGKAPKGGRRQSERSPVHQQDQHSSTQEDRNRDPHNAE